MNFSFLREDEMHIVKDDDELDLVQEENLELICRTLTIKCEEKLSSYAKSVVLSWKMRTWEMKVLKGIPYLSSASASVNEDEEMKSGIGTPFYYANEDILDLLKFNRSERDSLQRILHSMAIFLQNATCTNFFAICIIDVKITEVPKSNRKLKNPTLVDFITFKLSWHVIPPSEEPEIPW